MHKQSYYVVNGITLYRLAAAPVLVVLAFAGQIEWFKWLLAISFFTDLIDGYLARKFKVMSVFGSRLDSMADDSTIVAAIIGILTLKTDFIKEELVLVILLLALFLFQLIAALIRYKKISSFHTYSAKVAAIFQGVFLILIFFTPEPLYWLFYIATALTAIDLIEESILVFLLPKWQANVKGLYWVIKKKKPVVKKRKMKLSPRTGTAVRRKAII